MVQKTRAIVISSIKYGDTGLICTCYTQEAGIKSYLLKGVLSSRKGKIKKAFFQPLTQLLLVANHNNKGHLNSIKEVQVLHHYQSLHTDIVKQSISLFLSEILLTVLREEEQNKALFHYLETAFIWLDTHDKVSNFHLLFLLNLTRYLGFFPTSYNKQKYFDLVEGEFLNNPKSQIFISTPQINYLKTLLGTNFDALPNVVFNASQRQEILEVLIQYISLHLQTFRKPKSLAILHSLFK